MTILIKIGRKERNKRKGIVQEWKGKQRREGKGEKGRNLICNLESIIYEEEIEQNKTG